MIIIDVVLFVLLLLLLNDSDSIMQLIVVSTGSHRRPPPGPDRAWVRVQQTHAEDAAVDEVFGASSERHALPWRHREQRSVRFGVGILLKRSPARYPRGQ